MFETEKFLADLDTFIRFKTCVDQNRNYFDEARAWIRRYFDDNKIEILELTYNNYTNMLIKPRGSRAPKLIGDGHIEVVPAEEQLFELRRKDGLLFGRGVADMKTQCLMMMTVFKEVVEQNNHNDFWLLFSEDEEVGSNNGVRRVVDYLSDRDWLPELVFVPDGGPDFAYVEKEKGMITFSVTISGQAAHGSRPFLGVNAIERAFAFYEALRNQFPNPKDEEEWVPSLAMTTISAGEASNQIPDRCQVGFDMRFTEKDDPDELIETIRTTGRAFSGEIALHSKEPATYYPRERPLARKYIELLGQVSGKTPKILHTNGASNGRFYVAKKPNMQVLITNPSVIDSHADGECLVEASLEPFYRLVHKIVQLP